MRSILTKLIKSLRFIGVLALITGWVFGGWPVVPFLNFPSKIQQASAAVSYVDAGTIAVDATTGCTITPGPPTHQTNDILIAVAWNEGGGAITTATAGWALIADGAGTNDATWWWKRAAAAGTAGPAFTASNTDCYGIVYAIRGTVTTGTPFVDATTSGDGGTLDTTPDTATITTTNINQMVFSFMAESDDIAFSSGNPPTDWSADSNVAEGTGTDASFHVISQTIAAIGDVNSVVIGTFAVGKAYFAQTLAFIPPPSATLTGTATSSITETDIVNGGKTIILTLTNDNWVADGATFNAQRQAIINGIDSGGSEAAGWDAEVKAKEVVGAVVRTSATVVTITLTAAAAFDITATETITAIIPAAALLSNAALTASPTFTITHIDPTFTQNTYSWYVDNDAADPTEPWGTPDLPENTPIAILPPGMDPPNPGAGQQELRLRVNITVNTANLPVSGRQFRLYWQIGTDGSCTTGSWNIVGSGAWTGATSSVTDGADITAVLSTTTAGKGEEYVKGVPSQTNHVAATVGQVIEYDWHIVPGGGSAQAATTYKFRVEENDGTALDAYTNCAILTTKPSMTQLMRHGNVFSGEAEKGFFWAD